MVELKIKLKGSTLIEVIVAMTILAITVTAAFTVVSNYQRTGSTRLKNIAHSEIERIEKESLEEQNFLDETTDLGYLKLVKKSEEYRKNENLILLSIEAFDRKEKRIAYKKILIRVENKE